MKVNFQRSIAIGAALFSSYVFAGSVGHQPSCASYNNFYLGANIGVASLRDKESTNNPIRDVHYLSSMGLIGGGLLGYDFILRDRFKLGLEGFINGTDLNLSDNQNYLPVTSYTVNMHYNVGIRLLPSYEFTPDSDGHIIVGYSYAKFGIKDNGNYGIVNTQFKRNGLQLGLGIKTAVYHNLSIRTDVLYTTYVSQTSNGLTTSTPTSIQVYRNNLATLEGNLALIYKFS